MTPHRTGLQLQDHWGNETGACFAMSRSSMLDHVIYFDAWNTPAQTPGGPVPPDDMVA